MGRLRWVQHLMAGLRLARVPAKNTGVSAAAAAAAPSVEMTRG